MIENPSAPSALRRLSILLLEDDALISLDAEEALLALGAGHVLVAHTIEEAEALIARERIDAAVLDLMIGRGKSDGLASRLVGGGVPVVFASGLGGAAALPEALREVPTVDKPYSPQALAAALAAALLAPPAAGGTFAAAAALTGCTHRAVSAPPGISRKGEAAQNEE